MPGGPRGATADSRFRDRAEEIARRAEEVSAPVAPPTARPAGDDVPFGLRRRMGIPVSGTAGGPDSRPGRATDSAERRVERLRRALAAAAAEFVATAVRLASVALERTADSSPRGSSEES
jgi:hypothetical protein